MSSKRCFVSQLRKPFIVGAQITRVILEDVRWSCIETAMGEDLQFDCRGPEFRKRRKQFTIFPKIRPGG